MWAVALLLACGGDKPSDTAGRLTETSVPALTPVDSSAPTSGTSTGSTSTGTLATGHTGDTGALADSARTTPIETAETGDTAPVPVEVCGSGLDDDGDGDTDCADADCACTVGCFEERIATAPNLLTNGGFEAGSPVPGGLPLEPGLWSGDRAEAVESVGAPPFEGALALAALATGPDGPADDRFEVVQVVDATELRGDRLCIGAAVRRAAGDGETDTAFGLEAWSYLGAPDELADRWPTLLATDCATSGSCAAVEVAAPEEAWTVLVGELYVTPTPGVASIAVRLSALEDVVDDAEAPELDGHGLDAVWLYAP